MTIIAEKGYVTIIAEINSIGDVLQLKPELELEYSQKAFFGGQLTVAVETIARKRDRDLRKYEK